MPELVDIDDDDEDDEIMFGEFPNPDPEDHSPWDHKNQFVYLVLNSPKCQTKNGGGRLHALSIPFHSILNSSDMYNFTISF